MLLGAGGPETGRWGHKIYLGADGALLRSVVDKSRLSADAGMLLTRVFSKEAGLRFRFFLTRTGYCTNWKHLWRSRGIVWRRREEKKGDC